MNTNRMANMSLEELQNSALTIAQVIQSKPEENIMAAVLVLKLLEELDVCEISDLYIIAENMLVDLNASSHEKFQALKMYITHELT